jgi:ribonuclease P protein subunit RPR2
LKRRLLSRYRDLVRQRYEIVFKLAVESLRRGDKEYARKLCAYIKEMAERTRVRVPRAIKRSICKNCYIPLIPGLTSTIRLRSQSRRFAYRVVRCKECGYIHRYPYKVHR